MGSLTLVPLAELLEFLARRRVTGSLTCERGTVRKTLHLNEGAAVGAASNDPREFLGQLLMNFGHLTEEQLAKAFQTQEETRVRLGKVLTMVGLVAPETVRQVLGIKIRETILDVFQWDAGVFSVDEGPPHPADDLDVVVPLPDLVREADFRATAWAAFRAQFPTGAATLVVDEERLPPGLEEGSVDGRLVMLAVEGKTIDEIGLALHATDFHLYQRLFALAQQGVLRAAPVRVTPPEAAGDAMAATELLERARALLGEGRHAEAEAAAARAAELAPSLETARALLAEAQRALREGLSGRFLDPPRVPRLRMQPHEIALLRLSAVDKYLLGRCDGERDLRQILQVAPLPEIEGLKAFQRFVESRIVELA